MCKYVSSKNFTQMFVQTWLMSVMIVVNHDCANMSIMLVLHLILKFSWYYSHFIIHLWANNSKGLQEKRQFFFQVQLTISWKSLKLAQKFMFALKLRFFSLRYIRWHKETIKYPVEKYKKYYLKSGYPAHDCLRLSLIVNFVLSGGLQSEF